MTFRAAHHLVLAALLASPLALLAPTTTHAADAPPVVVVDAVALPAATVGEPYEIRVAAQGEGAWRFSARRRDLPRGLRVKRDGRVIGTPRRAGTASFPIRMKRRGRPRLRLSTLFTLDVRDVAAWTRLGEDTAPTARWGHAAALDARRGRLVVFGGGSGVNWLNDLAMLDLAAGDWAPLDAAGPAPIGRWGHSLVIDAEADRAIVFGGMSVAPYDDLWSLDLATGAWEELTPDGPKPPARRSHVAAFDPATRTMLVFGGSGLSGDTNDLWALDLAGPAAPRWRSVSASGDAPSARSFASAAFDATSGRWFVVGGATASGTSDEIHVLDLRAPAGPAWTHVVPTGDGPGALTSAVVAFDDHSNRLIVFGGDASGTLRGTVHALDVDADGGPVWSLLQDTDDAGPGARASAAGVIDPATSRLVVVLGNDGVLRDDAWALDVSAATPPPPAWETRTPLGPSARMNHTLIADPARGRIVLYGGFDGAYRGDTWSLDVATSTWTELTSGGPTPPIRFAHGAVLDAARDRMLVVAGSDGSSGGFDYFADIWSLDLAASTGVALWSEIVAANAGPPPRDEHVTVLDTANDRVLVFGGFDDFTVFADLWAFDLRTRLWTEFSPTGDRPAGRAGAAGVFDSTSRRLVVFGGGDGAGFLGDLWTLDCAVPGAETWTRLDLANAPAGRTLHTMVLAPGAPSVVLAGGQALGMFDDAFRLSLVPGAERWERLEDVAARVSAAGAFDVATRSVVLHGGLAPTPRGELLVLPPR